MLKQKLIELLKRAAAEAQQLDKLPSVTLPEVVIEHPQNAEHGDYALLYHHRCRHKQASAGECFENGYRRLIEQADR